MSVPDYQQYHYSYNQPSAMTEKYDNPQRRPTRRNQSARSSEGTVSTMMSVNSTGRESVATHVTQGPSYSKKIVVVGDGGCGKTCLLISYSQGYFPEVSSQNENFSALSLITHQEIRSNGLRELHHLPYPPSKRKDCRARPMGHGWTGGI